MKYKITPRKRRLAIFLLLTFLQSIVLPPVASALTSGPTTPETMSFEPVDATDMVNLQTGDFTYNIPLLEVPGPEGGYPLSLSYHAGIKPLEDASWVGLGWNLSPGAINRTVNGYPDDHKNVRKSVTDIWYGGETNNYSIGIGIGIAGANFGLDFSVSNDTYRGFQGSVGLSGKFDVGPIKAGVSASVGTGGVGITGTASLGPLSVSAGTSGFRGSVAIGAAVGDGIQLGGVLSTDFRGSTSAGFSVNDELTRLSVGLSLSSAGVRPSLSLAGYSAAHQNNNAGKITSYTVGMTASLIFLPISIGNYYTRYFIHETDDVMTNGVLHASSSTPPSDDLSQVGVIDDDELSFDSYGLLQVDNNLVIHKEPDWVLGGNYPAYDNFNVSGQGIGGTIQPYIFENGSLYRKQLLTGENGDRQTAFYCPTPFEKKVNFRFKNDFSNHFNITPPALSYTVENIPIPPNQLGQDVLPAISDHIYSLTPGKEIGFEESDFHLAGSKHIEWYTNEEITNGNAPTLIDYPNFDQRNTFENPLDEDEFPWDVKDQIGGVSITNESGVTYHYALPVYSYDEYSSTIIVDIQSGSSKNEQFNEAPYAYTWLLTAITGPDYIDSNNDGKLDEGDWGYWVEFDYGLWTNTYKWRTPSFNSFLDIDGKSYVFSYGVKEIYYLDAIKTRTHTALFAKSIRKDGKSVSQRDYGGGFTPQLELACGTINNFIHSGIPRSQMRLDEILLFNNKTLEEYNVDFEQLKTTSNPSHDAVTFTTGGCGPSGSTTIDYHFSDNVIDVEDINSNPSLFLARRDVIKTIKFDNDHYDLCPETANSFENIEDLYATTPTTGEKLGKLTLKSLKFKGQDDATVMPPLNFYYDYEQPTNYAYNVWSDASSMFITGATDDWVGEIVKYTHADEDYYVLLKARVPGHPHTFAITPLGENLPLGSHTGTDLVKTKNPPFNAKKYDYWSFYKPDFEDTEVVTPIHVSRNPNSISCESVDAWSLRTIETSLGAKIDIEYENKKYQDNVWQEFVQLTADGPFDEIIGNEFDLTFVEEVDLTTFLAPQDVVEFTGMFEEITTLPPSPPDLVLAEELTVVSVTPNTLRLELPPDIPTSGYKYHKGFIKFTGPGEYFGNGVRVKSVAVVGDGDERKTHYNYQNGVVSYNPAFLGHDEYDGYFASNYETEFKRGLSNVIALARELPAPMVLYENVGVSESYNNITVPGEKRYTFQIPEKDMLAIEYSELISVSNPLNTTPPPMTNLPDDVREVTFRTVTLKDKTSQIGNLLKTETFNGQGLLVDKVEYTYADTEADFTKYENQGVIHQAFNEVRIKYTDAEGLENKHIKGAISIREEYPSVLKSVTNYDNGLIQTTENSKYDFFTGQLLVSESDNLQGEIYQNLSIPAYEKYPEMGLKVQNINNHHMLTQTAYTQIAEVNGWGDQAGIVGVLDANVTTWNKLWWYRELDENGFYKNVFKNEEDDPKVWRRHREYSWKSFLNTDGTYSHGYPHQESQYINWEGGTPFTNVDQWELTSEVSLYNYRSNPIEVKDVDDRYAATKIGYDESLVIATINNAKYPEFAFCGAEDFNAATGYFGGEVKKESGVLTSDASHTGDQAIKLTAGQKSFVYRTQLGQGVEVFTINERRYRASVWCQGANLADGRLYYRIIDVNGDLVATGAEVSAADYVKKAGDWYLVQLDMEIPGQHNSFYLEVGVSCDNSATGDVFFDDFRFHPLDVGMTSYVYNQITGQLTYILDGSNMYTYYKYDKQGRLEKTYVETTENPTGRRLLSENEYKYKRPMD